MVRLNFTVADNKRILADALFDYLKPSSDFEKIENRIFTKMVSISPEIEMNYISPPYEELTLTYPNQELTGLAGKVNEAEDFLSSLGSPSSIASVRVDAPPANLFELPFSYSDLKTISQQLNDLKRGIVGLVNITHSQCPYNSATFSWVFSDVTPVYEIIDKARDLHIRGLADILLEVNSCKLTEFNLKGNYINRAIAYMASHSMGPIAESDTSISNLGWHYHYDLALAYRLTSGVRAKMNLIMRGCDTPDKLYTFFKGYSGENIGYYITHWNDGISEGDIKLINSIGHDEGDVPVIDRASRSTKHYCIVQYHNTPQNEYWKLRVLENLGLLQSFDDPKSRDVIYSVSSAL